MSISNRVDEILFLRKIEHLGLKPMWDHICRTNTARGNEYHNTEHMFGAAKLASKIWDVEVGANECASDTPEYRFVDVVVALLWHDFDHSGGKQSDVENIEDACSAFDHFVDLPEFLELNTALGYVDGMDHSVKALIRVTEFPFVHEPRYIAEKIVRDADLLYSFTDNTGPILHGLYQELSKSGRLPEDMSFMDMIQGQTKFHNEVQLFTQTGLDIHTDLKAEVIREQVAYGRKIGSLENA